MRGRLPSLRYRLALVYAAAIVCGPPVGAAHAGPTVVVADFDFSDTSGEVDDQASAHGGRLKLLSDTILNELEKHGLTLKSAACGKATCSIDTAGGERLIAAAKTQDAQYLVYGGIHKMSTLVQWMRVEMIDLTTSSLVASQLVTFRGDTDEAYERAGRFVSKIVLQFWSENPQKR